MAGAEETDRTDGGVGTRAVDADATQELPVEQVVAAQQAAGQLQDVDKGAQSADADLTQKLTDEELAAVIAAAAEATQDAGEAAGAQQNPSGDVQVDPKVLTDDRGNKELFTFEKTWGHRLLAGLGAAMLVIAIVLIVYFVNRLLNVRGLVDVLEGSNLLTIGYMLYGAGLAGGILMIPPALVAVYAAKHPRWGWAAVALAVIALIFVVMFAAFALATQAGAVRIVAAYTGLLALVPVVYLASSIKVYRCFVSERAAVDSDAGEQPDAPAADSDKNRDQWPDEGKWDGFAPADADATDPDATAVIPPLDADDPGATVEIPVEEVAAAVGDVDADDPGATQALPVDQIAESLAADDGEDTSH